MSAFLCSDRHINLMVTYGALFNVRFATWDGSVMPILGNEQTVATKLRNANIASLVALHGDRARRDDGGTAIQFEQTIMDGGTINPEQAAVQIAKLCHCFNYQSCEVENYEATVACRISTAIASAASRFAPGWDAAEWSGETVKVEPKKKDA